MNGELNQLLKDSRYAHKAMKADLSRAAMTRWQNKAVLENRLLSTLEGEENVRYQGPGTLSVSSEQSLYGTTALKVAAPTSLGPVDESHRWWAVANLVYQVPEEDWTAWNRLSVWVYADCPGYQNVWMEITLQNGGEHPYPRPNYFEGTNHVNIPANKWTRIVWELGNVYRDSVEAVIIGHKIHGSQADMAEVSTLYYNKLELSKVEMDHVEGWNTDERIAFCHSGYRPEDRKTAVTQGSGAEAFSVISEENGTIVFTAPVQHVNNGTDDFELLDFSPLSAAGSYRLQIGGRRTEPFRIDPRCFDPAIWKTINFFAQERCGCNVPGIHLPCHLDHMSVHPDGRRISVAGGWHDAGDLSQGQCNTAESILSFLEMAEKVTDDLPLHERLLEEAHWGLDWLLRTRFGDGYRCVWTTIGVWTKNIIGDDDDLSQPAHNDPFENFCGCAAEAAAARLFKDEDPQFAAYCLKCAREDFEFAKNRLYGCGTRGNAKECQLYGEAGTAAMELYLAAKEDCYLQEAARYADVVLQCQQADFPDWEKPLRGFFWEDRTKARPVTYEHRAHEQAMVLSLSMLVRFAPENFDTSRYLNGLKLYSEYIKAIAGLIPPYGLLPAGIYFTDSNDMAHTPRDHAQKNVVLHEDDYRIQVENGIRLSEGVYLRRFPVAFMFRGFFGVLMTKAKCVSAAALALQDPELLSIAKKQTEWLLGCNPFARSFMYGEGYDFPPMYSEFAFDMVGEVPVGIQTFENNDVPFMPMTNNPTYNEVWVHTSSRLLWTIADLY